MRASRLALLLVAGCGPVVTPAEGSDTEPMADTGSSTEAPPPPNTTSTTTASTSTTTGTPPSTTADSTTTGSETTGDIFLIKPDGFEGESCMCDVFAQDCPETEKCVPWADDGGDVWNCVRCSEIAAQPRGLGETCTVEGSPVSGFDDCGAGLVCWDVDPDTLQGTCIAMCTNSEADPQCEGANECLIANDGYLVLCLPACDPLVLDACPAGHACVPAFDAFVCAPSPGPAGSGVPCEPREVPDVCGAGSVCALSGIVPPCDGDLAGCCAALCDLSQADPCGELGLVCTSWWGADPVPAGYENVGFCALP